MDEAIEFLQDYLAAEHAEQVASYTERGYKAYLEVQKALSDFLAPSVTTGFSRTAFESEAYFGQYAEKAGRLAQRPLYAVTHHTGHPTHGDVYVGIAGGDYERDVSYARRVYAARLGDAWKVVAIEALDPDAEEMAWVRYRGRITTEHLGDPVEVRKLTPPEDPEHRAHYDAL